MLVLGQRRWAVASKLGVPLNLIRSQYLRGGGKFSVPTDLRLGYSLERGDFKMFSSLCFDEKSQWRPTNSC